MEGKNLIEKSGGGIVGRDGSREGWSVDNGNVRRGITVRRLIN